MASTSTKRFITTEDAVNYVMADNDSSFENFLSERESSDSSNSSDDDDTENVSNAQSVRGKTPIRRIFRTRRVRRTAATNIKVDALSNDLEFEKKWKKENDRPPIPPFTGEAEINIDTP